MAGGRAETARPTDSKQIDATDEVAQFVCSRAICEPSICVASRAGSGKALAQAEPAHTHTQMHKMKMIVSIGLAAFAVPTHASIWRGGREASSTCLPTHHPARYDDKPCPAMNCKCTEGGSYQSCDWCKTWSCSSSDPTSDCTPVNRAPPTSHAKCIKDCNCWCDGGVCPNSCRHGQCTCEVCDNYGRGNLRCDHPWHGEL